MATGCSEDSGNKDDTPAPKPAPRETIYQGDGWYNPNVRAFCDGEARVYVTWSENTGEAGSVVTVISNSPECGAK